MPDGDQFDYREYSTMVFFLLSLASGTPGLGQLTLVALLTKLCD